MSVIAVAVRCSSDSVRLDRMDFVAQLVFRHVVTRLASMVDVQQRTADPMAADFHCSLAFVRHVTIGTRDTTAGMNALTPKLELRVLSFINVGSRLAMFKVIEFGAVRKGVCFVGLLDLVDLEPFAPRVEESFFARTIILDMTLPTDETTHLLPARVGVWIVVPFSLAFARAFDARQMWHRVVALS